MGKGGGPFLLLYFPEMVASTQIKSISPGNQALQNKFQRQLSFGNEIQNVFDQIFAGFIERFGIVFFLSCVFGYQRQIRKMQIDLGACLTQFIALSRPLTVVCIPLKRTQFFSAHVLFMLINY